MQIWVDADALPKAIKEIIFRAAERVRVQALFVANKPLYLPSSPFIAFLQVGGGLDVADNEITRRVQPGDLVITADVPLAAAIVGKDAFALSPRGILFTEDNVGERLSVRNFLDELRGDGIQTGGPSVFGQKEKQAFANQLDRFLTRHVEE
ncbi:YaiI/YqxD family protein [bacterium]|nr:YaiI/YqxD family protein [candidate division CSSED10-310 bacterium]